MIGAASAHFGPRTISTISSAVAISSTVAGSAINAIFSASRQKVRLYLSGVAVSRLSDGIATEPTGDVR